MYNKTLKFLLIIFSSLSLMVIILFASKFLLKITHPIKYYGIVSKVSERYGVEKELIYAIIKCESNFDQKARSKAEACGLMQITPDTFDWLSLYVDDPTKCNIDFNDPETNITYGTLFLSILKNKYDDEKVVLSAYNAGPTVVNRWLNDRQLSKDGKRLVHIPYKETRFYVFKVKLSKIIYKMLYF